MFRRGSVYWTWAKLATGRKRVSLRTGERDVAEAAERCLARLASLRRWDVLAEVVAGRVDLLALVRDMRGMGEEPALAVAKARADDVDLSALVEPWLASLDVTPGTVVRYRAQIQAFVPVPCPASTFTPEHVARCLDRLTGSGATRKKHAAACSSFAAYCVGRRVLRQHPLRVLRAEGHHVLRRLKSKTPAVVYLSLEQSQRLVAAFAPAWRPLAALIEGAGVEFGAALKVRVSDVDREAHRVHIRGTKATTRDRWVVVDTWAWAAFAEALRGKLTDALVFTDPEGRPLLDYPRDYVGYPRRAYQRFRRQAWDVAARAVQVPRTYTVHKARHSWAVRYLRAGLDPVVVANQLGHADTAMLWKHYGRHATEAADLHRMATIQAAWEAPGHSAGHRGAEGAPGPGSRRHA